MMSNILDSKKKIIALVDQHNISAARVKELDISIYCKYKSNKWKIDFVGFVVQRNTLIVSFPKNYFDENDLQKLSQSDLISHIDYLIKYFRMELRDLDSLFGGTDPINSFPIQSYIEVCTYYNKYGLHYNFSDTEKVGFGGIIDWNKTLKNSNKYISNNNVVFIPFILKNKNQLFGFITECMKFVLTDGYLNFGSLFEVGIPFSNQSKIIASSRSELIIRLLREELYKVFKDSEKRLVLALIEYFEWHATHERKVIYLTTNFAKSWEKLVNTHLNKSLKEVLLLEDSIEEEINIDALAISFDTQVEQEVIVKYDSKDHGHFKVYYDHLGFDSNNIILLDSKYYFEKSGLDYKQLSYNYILLNNHDYEPNKLLINGLVMPSSKNSYTDVMLDWRASDIPEYKKVFIINFFINVQEIILSYIS